MRKGEREGERERERERGEFGGWDRRAGKGQEQEAVEWPCETVVREKRRE